VGLSAIRAAAARHALVLEDLAIKVVLGLDNAAKEHPAVHAGVGALDSVVSMRLLLVVRVPGCVITCGAIPLSNTIIVQALHNLCKYFILALYRLLTWRRTMSTQVLVKVDGQKLQKLRERRLWLVGDLAEKSGVHRNTISKLENERGGSYPETIRKLAKALDVEPTELLQE
jgi:DNA-binding XRE family transcriptional regulator